MVNVQRVQGCIKSLPGFFLINNCGYKIKGQNWNGETDPHIQKSSKKKEQNV